MITVREHFVAKCEERLSIDTFVAALFSWCSPKRELSVTTQPQR
jgi:hypothetical protein